MTETVALAVNQMKMPGETKHQILNKIYKPGQTSEELTNVYDEAGKDPSYKKTVKDMDYTGPVVLAHTLAYYLRNNKDARIIDVGSGHGLLAEELKTLGFNNLDALDPSSVLLELAKAQNQYKQYICSYFTKEVNENIKSDSYDALAACGTFIPGHMKYDALPEMIRCVKPGGLVVIVTREAIATTHEEFKDRLEPLMKQLETEGKWTFVERRIFADYLPGVNGIQYVFRKMKIAG